MHLEKDFVLTEIDLVGEGWSVWGFIIFLFFKMSQSVSSCYRECCCAGGNNGGFRTEMIDLHKNRNSFHLFQSSRTALR